MTNINNEKESCFIIRRIKIINCIINEISIKKKYNTKARDKIFFSKPAHYKTIKNSQVEPCGDLICLIFNTPVLVCYSKFDEAIKDAYENSGALIFDISVYVKNGRNYINDMLRRFSLLIDYLECLDNVFYVRKKTQ